jgi:hypothetical protein
VANPNIPEVSDNFKLVYVSGETVNKDRVIDPEFKVSGPGDIVKIVRKVEMY